MVHLILQIFHIDFLDYALCFGIFDGFKASFQLGMDVHAIQALAFAHLNADAQVFQPFVVLLKQEGLVRLKVNHHLIVLAFLNLFHGMGQVKLRQ